MSYTPIQQFTDRHLPLILFLSPVLAVNAAYLTASFLNNVPDCFIYLSGCTSISSVGRAMPQKGIFLLGMIPTAILSMAFWTKAENWFAHHGANLSHANKSLLVVGAVSSIFLLVYVTTLSIPGDFYRLTRKFAVLIYFGFLYITQLLLVKRLYHIGDKFDHDHLITLADRLKWFCVFVMLCGISIVPISMIKDPVYRKQLENVLEWNYALLLYLFFIPVYLVWRRHGPQSELARDQ